jgi:hypothetical protein
MGRIPTQILSSVYREAQNFSKPRRYDCANNALQSLESERWAKLSSYPLYDSETGQRGDSEKDSPKKSGQLNLNNLRDPRVSSGFLRAGRVPDCNENCQITNAIGLTLGVEHSSGIPKSRNFLEFAVKVRERIGVE